MGALGVLLLGVVIVIGGVLVLRLHAFVALILAALAVAVLTPREAVVRHALVDAARKRGIQIEPPAQETTTQVRLIAPQSTVLEPGTTLTVIRPGDDPWKFAEAGQLTIERIEPPSADAEPGARYTVLARVESLQGVDALSSDDLVLPLQDVRAARSAGNVLAPERVAAGFGDTAAGIGILIAFASIVGKCLLDSGAADRIVRSAVRITGEAGAPKAFVASGFLLGIPVFFDTVFYLMLPLGKALRLRTGRNLLLYVLTIVAGATMAHSLVPPTPGPLFVAEQLGVDIGLMILMGCAVGTGTSIAGYLWAAWLNRRYDLPLRETPDLPAAELTALADRPEAELPPLWLSLAPILLPVVLIGGAEVLDNVPLPQTPGTHAALRVVDLLGNKNVALVLAAAVSVGTLVWMRRLDRRQLAAALQAALAGAAMIILITSAGGAFGRAIQQSGIAALVGRLPVESTPAILALAFAITTAIRTAQGSATVAMITAVGVLAPLATSGALGFHPVWLALAIGCGSKPFTWMNDSGFWVITQMSGMTEAEGLRYVTTLLAVMAAAGLVLVIAGATLFPLV